MLEKLSGKTATNSISAILQYLLVPFKPSTTPQTKLTATTSLLSRTGASMNDTMEPYRDSTKWKPSRNTVKSKCRFGEEATIFLLLSSNSLTKGTHSSTKDTTTSIETSFRKPK